jgi:hypothetical protein
LLDSEDMLQDSTKQKFEESLFKNIAVVSKHDNYKKYFMVFQLARLFVYSFVPAVCSADLGVQSCCLLALQIVYCAAYLHTKPHFRSVFRRQVINELLLLVVLQNSLFFTDFLPPGQTKINLAQLDIIEKLFLVGLNFSWIFQDFVQFKILQSNLRKIREANQFSKSLDQSLVKNFQAQREIRRKILKTHHPVMDVIREESERLEQSNRSDSSFAKTTINKQTETID